jgi:sucrose-6-phosphate hydrolase SacC (GH32 family)
MAQKHLDLNNERLAKMYRSEDFRPQYHFTPASKWLNDPNGLLFYDGEYHLFYQHNPADTVWGPMHWGHAVSSDLLIWTHLPIALYPDENGAIYSGSAVIDWHNTAGFGQEAMVAIFTHHSDASESQSIASSTDKGRSWTKYSGNPVIEPPESGKDFRDPKVFWFKEGARAGHWVMVVSAGKQILFYTSPDLKNWSQRSNFVPPYGSTETLWETPDLFQLPVDGGSKSRWVLSLGVTGGSPAGGTGVQYFTGDFDGANFTSESETNGVLWADYGADFYAAQSWNDAPQGRRIWIAWMNDWRYAEAIPTKTWRGAMTLPRQLALKTTPSGIRLVQQPVAGLRRLRDRHWSWRNEDIGSEFTNLLPNVTGETLEIVAEFEVKNTQFNTHFGFRLRTGAGQSTTIGYITSSRRLTVDRTASGQVDFNADFSAEHSAVMEPVDDSIRLHIFVDRSSVEVFGNAGLVTVTDRIFPDQASTGIELFSEGNGVRLISLDIYKLLPAAFLSSTEYSNNGQV